MLSSAQLVEEYHKADICFFPVIFEQAFRACWKRWPVAAR